MSSKHKNGILVPIEYFESSDAAMYGRGRNNRYPVVNVTGFDGKPAVHEKILPQDKEIKEAQLLLPEHIVRRLKDYAEVLAEGSSQEGLYTRQREIIRNCASFVSDMAGVEFDHRLFEDTSNFNGWEVRKREVDYKPAPGEFMLYGRPNAGKWLHWGMGVGGDTSGVIGIGGPNGHGFTIASSPDIAVKAMGHSTVYTATHPDIQDKTAA